MGNMRIFGGIRPQLPAALLLGAVLSACSGGGSGSGAASGLSPAAKLGQQIFADTALSTSGKQSCATCHVARFAFAEDNSGNGPDGNSPVPLGGTGMNETGFRNTPSLMYASFAPAFYFDGDGGPNGGFFRDGRAATLADQAQDPFTTAFEMGNADNAAVVAEGQKLFMHAGCNGCHGGNGGGGMCPPLTNDTWVYGGDDDTLFRLVSFGSDELQKQGYSRKGHENVVGPMPPHGTIVKSDDDLWKIITFIRSNYHGSPDHKFGDPVGAP